MQFCSVLCTMVAEKLYEFAAKEIGAVYAHGENCIHAPAAALPWGKAALQADGTAQGRPANRSGYVYITDDPDYLANSSYFYWKVGRIGQGATFVLLEIDACALDRTQPIMRVLEHHEFAVPAVPPEFINFA